MEKSFPPAWHRAQRWLQQVPIADPVDRRNAPMLQLVLLLIAIPVPLLWLYRILGTDIAWRPGETLSLATSLFLSLIALFCFALVRRGRFQWAIRQLLVLAAAVLLLTYASQGMSAHVFELPLQVMWMFVAGMMIGRRALWAMYAVLVTALAIGAVSEARMLDEPLSHLLGDALIRSLMFLVIAVVVDRTTRSLRDSLSEATARGRELEAANRHLEAEILARERAQDQLLHAQKIETVGHMASGVAHDFNHLLGLVLGYAQRGRQEQDVGQLHAMFEGVESAARRAAGVSRRLLDFSRLEATHPKVFDAAGLVEELRPMMRHMFPDEVELRIELPSTPQHVFFDPDQLELMLLNLASNAAEAMPAGGVFTVSLPGPDPQWVEISAGDTGRGMTPEEVDRCREPFYTTKPAGQGTGLGLSVASDLVGRAGGELLIDSVPGEGTTVRVRLPRRTPVC